MFCSPNSLVSKIASLQQNAENNAKATAKGLNITTVAWEDTARDKNSCMGPNISDMTLNVNNVKMPMIRKPNFADVTADVDISKFSVTVGNEQQNVSELERISLSEYLQNLEKYTSGFNKESTPLVKSRDEVILCSAQACILPLKCGRVDFVPQIFNYQSSRDSPAVLVVVASSQGTSAHVISEYAQKLYFNRGGLATEFSATRLSDDRKERNVSETGEMTSEEKDRNALFIYLIPLVVAMKSASFSSQNSYCLSARGMESAMLSSSDKSIGSFKGLENIKLERDERYPIRVTVQFYSVTDDPVVSDEIFTELHDRIESVYKTATTKGSLVVDNSERKTETVPIPTKTVSSLPPIPIDLPLFAGFSSKIGNDFEILS